MSWAAVLFLALIAVYLVGAILQLSATKNAIYLSIVIRHYPATIGLPIVALTSLVLVYLLEYSRGPIEFEGLGFSFKGASGPLIFWVICFLAISLSVSTMWKSEYTSSVADRVLEELVVKDSLKHYIDTCIWLKQQQLAGTDDESAKRRIQAQCAAEAETLFKMSQARLADKMADPLGRLQVTEEAAY